MPPKRKPSTPKVEYVPLETYICTDKELYDPVPNWSKILSILIYRYLYYGTPDRHEREE